jgi:hypothetical protein
MKKNGRWTPDEQDLWCHGWAATRRKIHGIGRPENLEPPGREQSKFESRLGRIDLSPKERIGQLRSTLGRIREEKEGASALFLAGSSQNWPEVYTGISLLVHRCWIAMPRRSWMLVMDAHYVWREIPIKLKAPEVGMKVDEYWNQLRLLKAYLLGAVRNMPDSEEFVPKSTAATSFVRTFDPEKMHFGEPAPAK